MSRQPAWSLSASGSFLWRALKFEDRNNPACDSGSDARRLKVVAGSTELRQTGIRTSVAAGTRSSYACWAHGERSARTGGSGRRGSKTKSQPTDRTRHPLAPIEDLSVGAQLEVSTCQSAFRNRDARSVRKMRPDGRRQGLTWC